MHCVGRQQRGESVAGAGSLEPRGPGGVSVHVRPAGGGAWLPGRGAGAGERCAGAPLRRDHRPEGKVRMSTSPLDRPPLPPFTQTTLPLFGNKLRGDMASCVKQGKHDRDDDDDDDNDGDGEHHDKDHNLKLWSD